MFKNLLHMGAAKLIAFAALITIIIGIPVTIYLIKQNTAQPKAQTFNRSGYDTFGNLYFAMSDSGMCPLIAPPKQNPPINSYFTNITVSVAKGVSHTIHYTTYHYFCTSPYGGPNFTCLDNRFVQDNGKTVTVTTGHPVTITIGPYGPPPGVGSFCGTYQTDIVVDKIDNNPADHYGTSEQNVGGAGYCQTGKQCVAPKPTPTVTPRFTPTPTLTPPPGATRTPTPTVTPRFTPTPTLTPPPGVTYTVTPTTTLTTTPTMTLTPPPGVTYTVTPTSPAVVCGGACTIDANCVSGDTCNNGICALTTCVNNPNSCDQTMCNVIGATSTPTPTTAIAFNPVSTATPTIAAAGPGDKFVNIGIVGVEVILVGAALLLFAL